MPAVIDRDRKDRQAHLQAFVGLLPSQLGLKIEGNGVCERLFNIKCQDGLIGQLVRRNGVADGISGQTFDLLYSKMARVNTR